MHGPSSDLEWRQNSKHSPQFLGLLKLRFGILTEVKIRVEVFWVMTPCSVVSGYQIFGETYRLHLQKIVTRRDNREGHSPSAITLFSFWSSAVRKGQWRDCSLQATAVYSSQYSGRKIMPTLSCVTVRGGMVAEKATKEDKEGKETV